MMFLLVVPMSFISIKILFQWMRLVLWLAVWPLFFAILDGIGALYAAKSVASQTVGYGDDLTLLTQSLMADAAYDAYCLVMSLQVSVPFFLSWALVSGGGHALS